MLDLVRMLLGSPVRKITGLMRGPVRGSRGAGILSAHIPKNFG